MITNTTRNNDKTKSLLDLILTNSIYVKEAGTFDHSISDHQPIFVVKKKRRDHRPKVEFEGRSYRNYNRDKLKQSLLRHDWEAFYEIKNPNGAWDYILNQLLINIDEMCPIRTFTIKNYRPDWMTYELLEQIKDRDYFYLKAKRSGDKDAWNIAKHLTQTSGAPKKNLFCQN